MPHPPIKPVAVSCGDPAGIGPEIAAKAWRALGSDLPFLWIGDPRHLPEGTPVALLDEPANAARASADALPVLPLDFPEPAVPGQPSAANAASVVVAIERCVELAQSGDASAMCTAPISKKVLCDWGGFDFPGHTEYLAAKAGVDRVVMLLASADLKVVPATIHMPLSEVPGALASEHLERTLRITIDAMRRDFAIAAPRVVVAGLNPHAGEGGLLGHEDADVIAPVIARLAAEGIDIEGPLPADTMFHPAARAEYDVAVAMYHDQALIPIKTLAFDTGVNATLGLPFVRTSPDHGTAFGIAGQNVANPTSMIEALKLARSMAEARGK